MGPGLGRDVLVVLFATAAGFTVSGILSNLYRLITRDTPKSSNGGALYIALMVVAGPNVLLENAANSLKTKACSRLAFWLVALVAAYWSFAIGLFVLNLSLAL
jgi:hypothetical protein